MPVGIYRPPLAAEFPHDNPELFSGSAWVVQEPCGRARPIVPPTADELYYPTAEPRRPCPPSPKSEPRPSQAGTAESPGSDYDRFVSTLLSLAIECGATRVAATLTSFFQGGPLLTGALPRGSQEALVREGFASDSAGIIKLTSEAEQTAAAWRRALSGETDDLQGCGDSTLDTWSASFLGACLAYDTAAIGRLRRTLRRRGVAAFGMLAA
jgi:hypothetical protein